MTNNNTGGGVLSRWHIQNALFAPVPNRAELLKSSAPPAAVRLRVHIIRNHTIEPLTPLINQFARFGSWEADFSFSDYDDSLSGVAADNFPQVNAVLFWIDSGRYRMTGEEWAAWLAGRCALLRNHCQSPIVVATWTETPDALSRVLEQIPGVFFADIFRVAQVAKVPLLDARLQQVAGSPLSRPAQVVVAREIGCRYLPAVLFEPIKAVAVDLDNTLHQGVLGEDYADGVVLTDAHRELQLSLKHLKEKGILLALVSRNEEEDVRALFDKRRDYPLRYEDFSATSINWGDKADGVLAVAKHLRIDASAMLMIDDNPGELLSLSARLPSLNLLWADAADAANTRRALEYYPSLWRFAGGQEDTLRGADLRMNAVRTAALDSAKSEDHYFSQLQITLSFAQNERRHLTRMAQLSRKTNQFNFALCRLNDAQLAQMLEDENCDLAAVTLADKLCDSGVIAYLAAVRDGDELMVTEVCLSCRALGRRLESSIILGAVRRMKNFRSCASVKFCYAAGERNQPARDFLKKFAGVELAESGAVSIAAARIIAFEFNPHINLLEDTNE